MSTVSVILDVRQCTLQLRTAEHFIQLWTKLERSLASRKLSVGGVEVFDHSQHGRITVLPIEVSDADNTDRVFTIHSILTDPPVRYACCLCSSQHDRRVNGPYHCASGLALGRLDWLCRDHAVLLPGSIHAFHPSCVPSCSSGSGQPADFWCQGVRCKMVGGRPWSRSQLAEGNALRWPYLCRLCHQAISPLCFFAGCERVAYQHCEYVDPTTRKACGHRICSSHGYKWQIYGPEKEGLNLCPAHADLSTYTDYGIVEQMVWGTALRRRQLSRSYGSTQVLLPTLLSARHIFLNVRQIPYDLTTLRQMFEAAADRAANSKHRKRIDHLLTLRKATWNSEMVKMQHRREQALPILERVQAAYRSHGYDLVARSMRCADLLRLRTGRFPFRLLVYVAPDQIANFKGVNCRTLRQVEQLVGVELWLERDQQRKSDKNETRSL